MDSTALTVAIALAAGTLATAIARHLRIPGIVLLLGAGVLLGPDFLHWVRPDSLGESLHTLVGFAVAVILFEGGMNLDLRRMRRTAGPLRRLITIGAAVTALGGTIAARLLLDWPWSVSALFGCLVIVTGPTVITPLLRRIRVEPRVGTILEAEGVLGDAVGAVVAVVALEVVLEFASHPGGAALAQGAWGIASRLGFGVLCGLVAGAIIAGLLRFRHVVPDGLENVLVLSFALVAFHASNVWLHESGIVTVTIAGMVLGNFRTRALDELREFKEQLTVLLIGMLFVLLAADTRLEEVRALGVPGMLTVVVLMLVVRPLNILASTIGSDLSGRQRAFLMWIAPRGIVAAAVSSLFAQSLAGAGVAGGDELRALVFLVITVTVTLQGLTGGWLAKLLDVRRPSEDGYVIVGAGHLGIELAKRLREAGKTVVLIDSNTDACKAAQEAGFRALFGSALDERIRLAAGIDGREGVVALTPNDEVNLAFARVAHDEHRARRAWVALRRGHRSVTRSMVERADARVLFGSPRSLDLWTLRLERGIADVEVWMFDGTPGKKGGDAAPPLSFELEEELEILPLIVHRRNGVQLFDDRTSVRRGDRVVIVAHTERIERAHAAMRRRGWRPDRSDFEPEPDASRSPAAAG